MLNLREESLYLQGARDVLMRLQDSYDMYVIPSVKCRCRSKTTGREGYDWFPLNNMYLRKLVGKALLKSLIYDRESLVKFLQGCSELEIKEVKNDKKGNVAEVKLQIN
jgi:hypothetical protein